MDQLEATPAVSEAEAKRTAAREAINAAGRVSTLLNIRDVQYVDFSATAFYRLEQVPDDVEIKPRIGFTRPKVNAVGRDVTVRLTLVYSILGDGGEHAWKNEPLVTIRACTEARYRWRRKTAEQPVVDSDLHHFASIQTPFHVWGYWREFVQSALARFQLPILALPFFRMSDASRIVLDEDTD